MTSEVLPYSDHRSRSVKINKNYFLNNKPRITFSIGKDIFKEVFGENPETHLLSENKKIIISSINYEKISLPVRKFFKLDNYFYRSIIQDSFFMKTIPYLIEKDFSRIYVDWEIDGNQLIIHTDKEV